MNQKGLSAVILIITVLILSLVIGGIYYLKLFYKTPQTRISNNGEKQGVKFSTYSQNIDKTICPSIEPRALPNKPTNTKITSASHQDRFYVQFSDDSGIRLRDGSLISINNSDLTSLNNVLNQFNVEIIRLYSRPEQQLDVELKAKEERSCKVLADLNLAYIFKVPTEQDNGEFIDLLNALPIVELAEPVPVIANP